MSTRKEPQQGSATGKSLAVFTSGGDSQGMNAAVRACVRMAVYLGCQPYFIHEGYQGLVDGGDNITPAKWVSVSSIIHRGGTVIGSARCAEFRERAGRKKAAYNLVSRGISNLVIIGGDGSLTGANTLREEWPDLLDELLSTGEITKEQRQDCSALNIVGMVGTIDNDFCGTDMTIGADSALHRIIEVVDSVVSTASSHQRTFIIETMGAHCGFLALQSAIACEADYVFIPESPPPRDWPEQICQKLTQERQSGQRLNIIIVAEGALDRDGNHLTAETIKNVVSEQLQQDVRINVLGHMQRGGFPSAYDRIMASRVGAEATVALMEATRDTPPVVIGIVNNEIVRVPMMKSVQQTLSLKAAMAQKNWDAALDLRGSAFAEEWNLFQRATRVRRTASEAKSDGVRLAVMHIGVPACGMNAAVRAFVINSIHEGFTPLGIYDGMDGLFKGNIKELKWKDVCGWVAEGGAHLCTKDTMAEEDFGQLARRLREFNIQGLLFIGSFRAYASCLQMFKERPNYPEFRIPMCVIPATIDNNMPGTEISIGSDTSLNEITEICDRIRQSAQGTKQRVFVIETMGAYCGYLATLAAIAGGADSAYIFEEPFSVRTLLEDARYMRAKMAEDVQRGLILCNENASENYSTDFIHRLYKEEGKDAFSCRMNVLGHMQQGGTPSPFDRILGVHMGTKCVDWFKSIMHSEKVSNNQTACLLGYQQGKFKFTPIQDLVADSNFVQFLPKTQWWLKLRPLLKILTIHESAYMSDKRNSLPEPQTNAATANCNVNANNSEAQAEACRRAGVCRRSGACIRANDDNMNTQIKAVEKEQMERRERGQSPTSMLPHRYAYLSWPNSLIMALY